MFDQRSIPLTILKFYFVDLLIYFSLNDQLTMVMSERSTEKLLKAVIPVP